MDVLLVLTSNPEFSVLIQQGGPNRDIIEHFEQTFINSEGASGSQRQVKLRTNLLEWRSCPDLDLDD